MEVCNAIRTRIINIDQKYESQPFFLFVNKSMPPKGITSLIKNLQSNRFMPVIKTPKMASFTSCTQIWTLMVLIDQYETFKHIYKVRHFIK